MTNSRFHWVTAFACLACFAPSATGESMRFYCGTYTTKLGHVDGKADGIGVYEIDGDSGKITRVGESPPVTNSSHMCLGPLGQNVYVSSEVVEWNGRDDGYLSVYGISSASGLLAQRQRVSSSGPGPAYVHLDRSGKYLLLANYVAGNAAVYPIGDDGKLGQPTSVVSHEGSSVNPNRQEGPHPHAIVPSPDNRFLHVPDLGIDRIVAYRFDANSGTVDAAPELDMSTPPGSGPRHFVFSPDGRLAFCSLELTSEMAAYGYRDGRLTERARLSTLPNGYTGESTVAEVRVSPDGQNVYVSNRGHDSLAVFSLPSGDEPPKLVEIVSTEGRTPRNFGLSPDGRWVVVGNQDSHTLVAFRRDAATGRLEPTGQSVACLSPAIICFVDAD